jgi:DNA-binding IscR family transcriptional regulator
MRNPNPRNHHSQILAIVSRMGSIRVARSTLGGRQLTCHPEESPLAAAVVLFDSNSVKPECLLGYNQVCSDERGCPVHQGWRETKTCILNFLKSTTLAEIADHEGFRSQVPHRGTAREQRKTKPRAGRRTG